MIKVFLTVLFFIVSLTLLHAYQNPSNYIDSVDVTQANFTNQKFSEWITANAADIDTLETLNEAVFCAVDTTGGQTVADADSDYITLDKEIVEASIYAHATDDYAVAVNQTGTYEVSYAVCCSLSSSSTTEMITSLCHYSSSWLNVPGTLMYNGVTDIVNGSTSATTILTLNSGDSLGIKLRHGGLGSANMITNPNGVCLTIRKLY